MTSDCHRWVDFVMSVFDISLIQIDSFTVNRFAVRSRRTLISFVIREIMKPSSPRSRAPRLELKDYSPNTPGELGHLGEALSQIPTSRYDRSPAHRHIGRA